MTPKFDAPNLVPQRIEVRVIQEVQRLGAELHGVTFVEANVLQRRDAEIQQARCCYQRAAGVAERERERPPREFQRFYGAFLA